MAGDSTREYCLRGSTYADIHRRAIELFPQITTTQDTKLRDDLLESIELLLDRDVMITKFESIPHDSVALVTKDFHRYMYRHLCLIKLENEANRRWQRLVVVWKIVNGFHLFEIGMK